jgi:ATP-dependent Clp protease ATP-binding subunit ClpA
MNIDLYSDRAKQAVQSAQGLALARRHQQLAPEHLLKVLLEEKDGLSRTLIQSAGGKPDAADAAVASIFGGAACEVVTVDCQLEPGQNYTPISTWQLGKKGVSLEAPAVK